MTAQQIPSGREQAPVQRTGLLVYNVKGETTCMLVLKTDRRSNSLGNLPIATCSLLFAVVFYESTKHKACKPRWGTQRINLESKFLSRPSLADDIIPAMSAFSGEVGSERLEPHFTLA